MVFALQCRSAVPLLWLALILHGIQQGISSAQDAQRAGETIVRQPWTTSRVAGSPDTPLPLSIVPAFPELKFENPMHIRWQPALGRYVVCELGGKYGVFHTMTRRQRPT